MRAGEQIRILHRDFANPTAEAVAEIIDREFASFHAIAKIATHKALLDELAKVCRESEDWRKHYEDEKGEREKLLAANAALRRALGQLVNTPVVGVIARKALAADDRGRIMRVEIRGAK